MLCQTFGTPGTRARAGDGASVPPGFLSVHYLKTKQKDTITKFFPPQKNYLCSGMPAAAMACTPPAHTHGSRRLCQLQCEAVWLAAKTL